MDFNIGDFPICPHKANIPHSVEILVGKRIGDYADLIRNIDVVVELFRRLNPTSVTRRLVLRVKSPKYIRSVIFSTYTPGAVSTVSA